MDGGGFVLEMNLVYDLGTVALGAFLALLVAAAISVTMMLLGIARLVLSAARSRGEPTRSCDRARWPRACSQPGQMGLVTAPPPVAGDGSRPVPHAPLPLRCRGRESVR